MYGIKKHPSAERVGELRKIVAASRARKAAEALIPPEERARQKEIAKLDRWLGMIGTTTYLCQDDDGSMKSPSGNVAQIISDMIDRRIAVFLADKEASE